jgi:hypothetical protein
VARKKTRNVIPKAVSARVLFLSDRTCCVCRVPRKPVQIHHIDEDPSNNSLQNLAVLCVECHDDTQIRGGFGRKLDAEQVILYRDDWHRLVARGRASREAAADSAKDGGGPGLELTTSIAEIYRENQEFELLAIHYHQIGNAELRDKYIDRAIEQKAGDATICYLRGLQGKPELIPEEVVQRELARYAENKDWLQRGRFLSDLGRHREAAADYIQGVSESLRDNEMFSAAYYMKEFMAKNLLEELFVLALKQAAEDGDLWWQVRALQELAWDKQLDDLVLEHAKEIESSEDPELVMLLAKAKGDSKLYTALRKEIARRERVTGEHVWVPDEDDEP